VSARFTLSVLAIFTTLFLSAQQPKQLWTPRFEDYPVTEMFTDTPAAPVLSAPEELRYRTVIRQGVSKGWGVEDGITGTEATGPGSNFAGHFIVIKWGCGTDCGEMAIVDAKTGRIFQPPFAGKDASYFTYPTRFMYPPQFRGDSNLLILPNACADATPVCGTYYFVWERSRWRVVHREPLPPGIMQPFY
jgi:hypothetical protein